MTEVFYKDRGCLRWKERVSRVKGFVPVFDGFGCRG